MAVRLNFLRGTSKQVRTIATSLKQPINTVYHADPQNPKYTEPKVSTLSNGVTVASFEDGSPTSFVYVSVDAGTRAEQQATRGASSFLRQVAFTATKNRSFFRITRESDSLGMTLKAGHSREANSFYGSALRDDGPLLAEYLSDVVSSSLFKEWEVEDQKPREALALSNVSCHERLVDMLHAGAFRRGLGRPFHPSPCSVENLSSNTVSQFVKNTFSPSRIVIAASGIDHDQLVAAVQGGLGAMSPLQRADNASQYFGGAELRDAFNSTGVRVGLAFGGVSSLSNDRLAVEVLRHTFSSPLAVQFGSSSPTRLVSQLNGIDVAAFGTYHWTYSDAGLFGFVVECAPKDAGDALKAVASAVKQSKSSYKFTDAELARAKAQVKAEMLVDARKSRVKDLAKQVLHGRTYHAPETVALKIDAVTAQDVERVAKAVFSSKPVLAVRGDIEYAPFLDELKL